jgi:hypothetical protein
MFGHYTANRHHPGESVIRFVHNNGSINRRKPYVARFPIPNFVCNRYTIQSCYCNAKKWDTILSYFIVSPDMHKVHHHYKLPTRTVIMAIFFGLGPAFRNV